MSRVLSILLLLMLAAPHGWCCLLQRDAAVPGITANCCGHCTGEPVKEKDKGSQKKSSCPCDDLGLFAREAARANLNIASAEFTLLAAPGTVEAAPDPRPQRSSLLSAATGPPRKSPPLFKRHCALLL